jgi:hypothetical protein
MTFQEVERKAESLTGLSVEQIRWYSPDELRKHLEEKKNCKIKFITEFPAIGRGNVLRDNIIDTNTINDDIDKILF